MRHSRTILLTVALVIGSIAFASGGVVGAGSSSSAATATQAIDADCEYPIERTDARGETITIDDEPEEVVTLYPGDAQLAYQIGAEDRVVGMPVGPYTDSLEAGDRTDITEDDGVTPVAEEIVALDPDVVLAANVALAEEDLIDQLEDAGITVYVLDTATSIDDVRENVEATGELTGECAGAEETVSWMDDRLELIEGALEDEDEPLALYAMGEDGTTPGTATFQHEVLTTAGLENVAERAGIEGWQEISAEVVVEEDPEWIVYPDWADEPPVAESVEETTAFQEDNVVAVDDNAMSQPAPGVVDVIFHLVETVHPDVYADIEADVEAVDEAHGLEGGDGTDESEDDAADGTDEMEATMDSDDESDAATADGADDGASPIPGFGAVGAIVALLTVGVMSRLR
ncbi:PGF-CTERM-anchored ABC transporter substrate-binding protein [Natrarchaeobius chitinivorans]|uniref:ABC transporter substrate-binding protein n=1 Tax=Natrarchaeobius chitinivorans TaxID=1679083 RepID=A0A3N6M113_NATCH|nr:PGF-CTERM-anchored ABC transporter substrate-binding protein [Natrarchaeobius chitinivorans]RQG96993.1 ABC transporter substrate-binding protein [Natrarchaeobius chitinivorans]